MDIGIVYCGDAAKLIEQDKKFKYILPAEGAHRFIDNLCIPAGSKNKEAAHKFINYVLRPDVSKIISDKFPYTNPNAGARKLLSRESDGQSRELSARGRKVGTVPRRRQSQRRHREHDDRTAWMTTVANPTI